MALASEQKAKRGLKLPRLHTMTLTLALTLTPVCFAPSPPSASSVSTRPGNRRTLGGKRPCHEALTKRGLH